MSRRRGEKRVGGHFGLELGAYVGDDPRAALPGVLARWIVQDDESAARDFVVARVADLGGHREREGREPLRRRGFGQLDLRAHAHRPKARDRTRERLRQLRLGVSGYHIRKRRSAAAPAADGAPPTAQRARRVALVNRETGMNGHGPLP